MELGPLYIGCSFRVGGLALGGFRELRAWASGANRRHSFWQISSRQAPPWRRTATLAKVCLLYDHYGHGSYSEKRNSYLLRHTQARPEPKTMGITRHRILRSGFSIARSAGPDPAMRDVGQKGRSSRNRRSRILSRSRVGHSCTLHRTAGRSF